MIEIAATSLQLKFGGFSESRRELAIPLTFNERKQIEEALAIAEVAVLHRKCLIDCVDGKKNILVDPGETAGEIYSKAGMYELWRDGKVKLEE